MKMSGPNMHGPAPNEAKLDANDRLGMQQAARELPASQSSEIITTTKTTETTTTTSKQLLEDHTTRPEEPLESVATVEDLGRKASLVSSSTRTKPETDNQNQKQVKLVDLSISLDGSKAVTTIGTIAAQTSETRIVVALLKDGESFQLRVQEMRPRIFEVGSNYKECHRYLEEHEKIMKNLNKQRQAPLECWLNKYQRIQAGEPSMSNEMKLVYMCMAENLQGCWRALLSQLEARLQLLEETCRFYALIERLREALDKADNHVQVFRQEFLDGPGSLRFAQASKEIRRLNELVQDEYFRARNKQHQLVQLIAGLASNNLADSRPNHLIADGQNLINYINSYLAPLERRKIQLESVIKTTTTTTTTTTSKTDRQSKQDYTPKKQDSLVYGTNKQLQQTPNGSQQTTTSVLKEISTFNDLNLVENWLNVKIDQLNSSLLSSLGIEAQDSRPILAKHEQIALECSAIEEATLRFKGKNIHAIKQVEGDDLASANNKSLFEQQKVVANKTRDVITILDARIVLLRRTIDFYLRAKDATTDIGKMMRRLQVDNSLQSVQFVSNELELKDVSSVVASGATILSELQQLQLAQKHGQRSSIVNLNLQTNGIRSVIDRLNQDLAHLKTVLNQRKLVLLNEDATKMAQNFSNKCHQLQAWLNNHAKAYLLANSFAGGQLSLTQVSSFLDGHEQLRLAIQNKTLEVEALLRLLSTLTESFDAKSHIADEIQRDTDELRQDWINVTNCVDKRIELVKKYLAILNAASRLDKEMDSIEGSSSSSLTSNGRPRTPDERSQDDIRANVDQSLVQLTNQVRNFATDAKRTNTGLVYLQAPTATTVTNDINKDQLVEQANNLLKSLASRKDCLFDANRQPRKLQTNQKAPLVPPPPAAPQTTITTTKKTTTTTATNAKTRHPAGAKTNVVPIFTRGLVDKQVEPFSLVELECELDPASISEPPEASKPGEAAAASRSNCEVEWLMNNYKKIPPNIKHSIVSEGNRHRLIIGQFNPTCCGTYTARATDRLTGQWATSSCRLSLSGIKEDAGEAPGTVQATRLAATATSAASPDVTSTTSSFSQWRPSSSGVGATASTDNNNNNNNNNKTRALERIIKGVDSSEAGSDAEQPAKRTTSKTTTTTTTTTKTSDTSSSLMPVTRTIYNPNGNNNQLRINYIDSPTYSSSTNLSRSISRSPFEGSPQPPVFMQSLRKDSSPSAARSASRSSSSGLVCVVVGNPPPTIEWLHNNVPIATAKCPRPGQRAAQKGNICKLTIATNNNRDGQYVCRASNRLGQTSTALTLTK